MSTKICSSCLTINKLQVQLPCFNWYIIHDIKNPWLGDCINHLYKGKISSSLYFCFENCFFALSALQWTNYLIYSWMKKLYWNLMSHWFFLTNILVSIPFMYYTVLNALLTFLWALSPCWFCNDNKRMIRKFENNFNGEFSDSEDCPFSYRYLYILVITCTKVPLR